MAGELCNQPPLGVADTILPNLSMTSRWTVSPRTDPRGPDRGSPAPSAAAPTLPPTL